VQTGTVRCAGTGWDPAGNFSVYEHISSSARPLTAPPPCRRSYHGALSEQQPAEVGAQGVDPDARGEGRGVQPRQPLRQRHGRLLILPHVTVVKRRPASTAQVECLHQAGHGATFQRSTGLEEMGHASRQEFCCHDSGKVRIGEK
jgi:hypothetical protein